MSFNNGEVSGNTRTLSNLTECSEITNGTNSFYFGSYEVQEDKILGILLVMKVQNGLN
ncbi:hypothetical protein P4S64_22390 [Vibrio sp. M60_M31a]